MTDNLKLDKLDPTGEDAWGNVWAQFQNINKPELIKQSEIASTSNLELATSFGAPNKERVKKETKQTEYKKRIAKGMVGSRSMFTKAGGKGFYDDEGNMYS